MKTVHIRDLERLDGQIAWQLIGVFPVDPPKPGADRPPKQFMYSVGVAPGHDWWFDALSVEYRGLALDQFFSWLANRIILAHNTGVIDFGDTVQVPLGIPDKDGQWLRDEDSFWWIGEPTGNDSRFEANMTPAPTIIPVRWSSPLGWND
jgi:hypothetical protein